MKIKHIVTTAIATGLLVSLATTSFARPPRPIPDKQVELKTAMTSMGIQATNERVEFTDSGRRDLVLFANISYSRAVANMKRARQMRTRLAGDYRVIGWAKLDRRGSYSVTLQKAGVMYVAEIFPNGSGVKVSLWGVARVPGGRTPMRPVPAPRRPRVNR